MRRLSPATFSPATLAGNVELVRQCPCEADRCGLWKRRDATDVDFAKQIRVVSPEGHDTYLLCETQLTLISQSKYVSCPSGDFGPKRKSASPSSGSWGSDTPTMSIRPEPIQFPCSGEGQQTRCTRHRASSWRQECQILDRWAPRALLVRLDPRIDAQNQRPRLSPSRHAPFLRSPATRSLGQSNVPIRRRTLSCAPKSLITERPRCDHREERRVGFSP